MPTSCQTTAGIGKGKRMETKISIADFSPIIALFSSIPLELCSSHPCAILGTTYGHHSSENQENHW